MNENLLELLFKIPDPITVREFCRRTGKSESSVRKLVERRRLPIRTEKQLYGEGFTDHRLMIMWNEYLEMVYEATQRVPSLERLGWRDSWLKRAKKLAEDLALPSLDLVSVALAADK
ncbi:hypothetical protein [Yersinia enterocolitica]|uniref:hypothetical protein n=1 Tax=Yersinia enterocolitica TaxID=630 RepID=UPI001C8DDCF6|nr:hypothetical protein [Yersinia enterocolitica]MBX9476802.1 hypothetical protein [Yersinia enterocolitica]